LMLADRVDVAESRVLALAQGRPDNVITETGVLAEYKRHGIRSRVGQHRADLVHQPLSFLGVALPALAAVGAMYLISRRDRGSGSSNQRHPNPSAWRARDQNWRRESPAPTPVGANGGSRRYADGRGYDEPATTAPAE
jgi:hypothetical protein